MKSDDELDTLAREITQMTLNTENLSQAQATDLESTLASLDELTTIAELDELELIAAHEEELVEETIEAQTDEGEIIEAVVETAELTEDNLDELEMELDKAASYADQESAAVMTVDKEEIKTKGAPKATTGTGAKRTAAPRVVRDLNAIQAYHFVLTGDVTTMTDKTMNKAKADLIAAKPTQVKVAEKFEGMLQSMSSGRAPSKYIMTAFASLNVKKTMTSAEIIGAFKASGVGEGTARSQTGQIMTLFPVLGIATRSGKDLTLIEDSNIATYLCGHITPAS